MQQLRYKTGTLIIPEKQLVHANCPYKDCNILLEMDYILNFYRCPVCGRSFFLRKNKTLDTNAGGYVPYGYTPAMVATLAKEISE